MTQDSSQIERTGRGECLVHADGPDRLGMDHLQAVIVTARPSAQVRPRSETRQHREVVVLNKLCLYTDDTLSICILHMALRFMRGSM